MGPRTSTDSLAEAPGRSKQKFHLTRRRVYILPTTQGLAFSIALLVMLIGSVNYANSLGYLLTFLLLSVALVSLLHTFWNIAGLEIAVGAPEPAFSGNTVAVPVSIDNREGQARYAVCLSLADQLPARYVPGRVGRGRVQRAVHYVDLPAQSLTHHLLTVPLTKRGVHPLVGIEISSRFPLGLFRAWTPLKASTPIEVYAFPAPNGDEPLPIQGAGDTRDVRPSGQGREDFAGLRDYQRGDSPRHIHWKAVARGQPLAVKEFDGEGSVIVDLDWAATEAAGEAEARLGQLSAWVIEADECGAQYSLTLPHRSLAANTGGAHRQRALEALAAFPTSNAQESARQASRKFSPVAWMRDRFGTTKA